MGDMATEEVDKAVEQKPPDADSSYMNALAELRRYRSARARHQREHSGGAEQLGLHGAEEEVPWRIAAVRLILGDLFNRL